MRINRTIALARFAFAASVALPAAVHAQAGGKPDVTGKWSFAVQSDAGTGTPTVTIKQQGDSVSGHYSSQVLGERDFTGTFKNGKLEFSFSADVQGQQLSASFSGTMEGADAMKGSVDFGGLGSGTFTAKRQKP